MVAFQPELSSDRRSKSIYPLFYHSKFLVLDEYDVAEY